jgi:uncharacterized membrane protein
MSKRYQYLVAVAGGLLWLLTAGALAAGPPPPGEYTALDLGGGTEANGFGIEQDGTVFGQYSVNGALFTPAPVLLPTLPGGTYWIIPQGADGAHGVVGFAETGAPLYAIHAFLSVKGVTQDLGTLGDAALSSHATGVNAHAVVGYGDNADKTHELPLVWPRTGTKVGHAVALPTLGGSGGRALAINAHDAILGMTMAANGVDYPTLWLHGLPYKLETSGQYANAAQLNDKLMVVGSIGVDAWRWTPEHGSEDVGRFPGDVATDLLSVNNHRVAVGFSYPQYNAVPPVVRAVRFNGTTFADLNTLVTLPAGFWLEFAVGINDRGQIVATGRHDYTGSFYTFLLTPSAGHDKVADYKP